MIKDIVETTDSQREADVCIVGAGAAGILLALELMEASRSVILLEGGGLTQDLHAQALYDLESPLLPVGKDSRVRVFGGTTSVWTGGWKLLERDDLTVRDWMPLSGWPVSYAEMELLYDRAARRVCGPSTVDIAAVTHAQAAVDFSKRITESGALETTVLWELPERARDFGKVFRAALEASPAVRIFLNANVTRIERDVSRVRSLHIKTLEGRDFNVKASKYVIACGGIENARLLLASGIGNEHDQVGRYYMDHPKGTVGAIAADDYSLYSHVITQQRREAGTLITGFQLSPAFRSARKLPNCYVQMRPIYGKQSLPSRAMHKFFGVPYPVRGVRLRTFMEQVPSPRSRVVLGDARDAFGNPLARVEWSLSELDKEGARALHLVVQGELARAGLGTLTSEIVDHPEPWPITKDASHHMGTTRMGADPHTSVVDPDCRVHGVNNLFIAGSSVFPTGGNANPTATILALAVRLADHIKTI